MQKAWEWRTNGTERQEAVIKPFPFTFFDCFSEGLTKTPLKPSPQKRHKDPPFPSHHQMK